MRVPLRLSRNGCGGKDDWSSTRARPKNPRAPLTFTWSADLSLPRPPHRRPPGTVRLRCALYEAATSASRTASPDHACPNSSDRASAPAAPHCPWPASSPVVVTTSFEMPATACSPTGRRRPPPELLAWSSASQTHSPSRSCGQRERPLCLSPRRRCRTFGEAYGGRSEPTAGGVVSTARDASSGRSDGTTSRHDAFAPVRRPRNGYRLPVAGPCGSDSTGPRSSTSASRVPTARNSWSSPMETFQPRWVMPMCSS
jgi:hypothetical protein